MPQFCQECGKKPCETFIVCAQRSIDGYQKACADMLVTLGDDDREAVVPLTKACTCGAVKTGTGPCSSWCDAA